MKQYEEAEKYYLEEINKGGYILAYLNLALICKDVHRDYDRARYYILKASQKIRTTQLYGTILPAYML